MKKILICLLLSSSLCSAQVILVSQSNAIQINGVSYPLNTISLNINHGNLFELDFVSGSDYYSRAVTRNQSILNCYLDGVQCTDTGTLRSYYLANFVSSGSGGATLPSVVTGDILYASGTNTISPRHAGANGLALVLNSGVPIWGAPTITTLSTISSYNGISTSGVGMPYILSSVDISSQTTSATLSTFATTSTGTYQISGYLNVTAISTDVINLQVAWKDENNVSRTQNFAASGISATGFNSFNPICIRALTGTNIVVSTVLSVGTGSITYDCGERIIQF